MTYIEKDRYYVSVAELGGAVQWNFAVVCLHIIDTSI